MFVLFGWVSLGLLTLLKTSVSLFLCLVSVNACLVLQLTWQSVIIAQYTYTCDVFPFSLHILLLLRNVIASLSELGLHLIELRI